MASIRPGGDTDCTRSRRRSDPGTVEDMVRTSNWLANKYYRPGADFVGVMNWGHDLNRSHRGYDRGAQSRRTIDPKLREIGMNLEHALASIDWTVVDELKHIPRGAAGSGQESLRLEYAAYRSLHRRMSPALQPSDALVQAIVNVQRTQTGFAPRYDHAFFFGGATVSATLADDELAMEIHSLAHNGGGSSRRPESTVPQNGHVPVDGVRLPR